LEKIARPPKKNPKARADSSPDPSSARTKSKNKLVSVLRKSKPPENSFRKTESELKPRHLPEYLEGRTPKRKNVLSILEKITPAKNQKSKEHFFFLVLPSEARQWRGFRRAYEKLSYHHALRACDYLTLF
jgi:hypothetical protein